MYFRTYIKVTSIISGIINAANVRVYIRMDCSVCTLFFNTVF